MEPEDRSRLKNIKLQEISETVQANDLYRYARKMLFALLPDIPSVELSTDHIHHIPRPFHLADTVLRDVLKRVYFFHVKKQFLSKAQFLGSLPAPYENVNAFADLSQ